jgi:hypothetical protein
MLTKREQHERTAPRQRQNLDHRRAGEKSHSRPVAAAGALRLLQGVGVLLIVGSVTVA